MRRHADAVDRRNFHTRAGGDGPNDVWQVDNQSGRPVLSFVDRAGFEHSVCHEGHHQALALEHNLEGMQTRGSGHLARLGRGPVQYRDHDQRQAYTRAGRSRHYRRSSAPPSVLLTSRSLTRDNGSLTSSRNTTPSAETDFTDPSNRRSSPEMMYVLLSGASSTAR